MGFLPADTIMYVNISKSILHIIGQLRHGFRSILGQARVTYDMSHMQWLTDSILCDFFEGLNEDLSFHNPQTFWSADNS